VTVPGFTVYRGVHRRGSVLPRHFHADPTICYVLAGRFTEYTAGQAVDCVSDALKVTPAGETHWNRFAAGETRGLRIDVDRRRFADSPRIGRLLDERVQLSGRHAGDLPNRLASELDARDEMSAMAIEGLLLELLATLARDASQTTAPAISPWLHTADEMIHDLYASRITLGTVARTVGVAPATLARGYRSAFQISVGERIRQLRIDRAARELLAGDELLSKIALAAGFYDQSHFTNQFRRRFGVTPGHYRRTRSFR
jgi:AraC family transcriptional regulator